MSTSLCRRRVRGRAVVTALVLMASAACGGGGDEAAAPDAGGDAEPSGDVTFVAEDIRYEEAPDQVAAGRHVFELANAGSLPHTVTIEELDDRTIVSTAGGVTATGEVELEPGTYTYYCSVGNHRQQGMEGTLEVTEG